MTTAKNNKAEPVEEMEMEMEMVTVTLEEEFLKFIPGPASGHIKVLKDWCRENCTGKYSVDQNGIVWTFMEASDGKAFHKAWNKKKVSGELQNG